MGAGRLGFYGFWGEHLFCSWLSRGGGYLFCTWIGRGRGINFVLLFFKIKWLTTIKLTRINTMSRNICYSLFYVKIKNALKLQTVVVRCLIKRKLACLSTTMCFSVNQGVHRSWKSHGKVIFLPVHGKVMEFWYAFVLSLYLPGMILIKFNFCVSFSKVCYIHIYEFPKEGKLRESLRASLALLHTKFPS